MGDFEFKIDWSAITGWINPKIDSLMRASGEAMQEDARHRCPVDTGQLRDSIGYVYDQQTKTVKLYADKHYAAFVEFGYHARNGRIVPPRPFLRPAMYAASRPWGGTTEVQVPGLKAKYIERTERHIKSFRLTRRRRITVGHGRFR